MSIQEDLQRTTLRLYKYREGQIVSAMLHIGNRLGLFATLADAGPSSSTDLADATALDERWVREWLFCMSAAELVDHDDGVFTLTPAGAATLGDDTHPGFMAGVFGPPIERRVIDRTIEAFRTGIGISWDEHGAETCHVQAAMGASGQAAFFVPVVLGGLDGLTGTLTAGATVVDVGCGTGVAARAVATAFPNATVLGLDPSAHAIDEARSAGAGMRNLEFQQGTFDDLPDDGSVDLLMTIDVLHDLPRPGAAVAAARRAVGDRGTWLVADIKSAGDLESNRKIPVLPLMYGMSVLYCMSSALSEPSGAGLGTLGLTPAVLEALTSAAGFTRFTVHDHETDPTNLHYEIRA